MSLVVLKVVFLFPLIANVDIQEFFTGGSWIPGIAFQRLCRAGLYAAPAMTAEASLYGWTTWNFNVSENGSQPNP
jgi:hypothetical protein